jgi:hypothetical protein
MPYAKLFLTAVSPQTIGFEDGPGATIILGVGILMMENGAGDILDILTAEKNGIHGIMARRPFLFVGMVVSTPCATCLLLQHADGAIEDGGS